MLGAANVDGAVPALSDVLSDDCYVTPPPLCSRLPAWPALEKSEVLAAQAAGEDPCATALAHRGGRLLTPPATNFDGKDRRQRLEVANLARRATERVTETSDSVPY